MGTNATRKAASKIVAILLAALMLISVMPMTAFAAEDDNKLVIDGMSLTGYPVFDYYYVGDSVDLTGLEIEITYRKVADIEKYGERAIYYADTIAFDTYANWTKALSQYGIDCNFSEYDKTAPEKKAEKLDMEDNFESIVFAYGENGKQSFDTGISFPVLPLGWTSAAAVEEFTKNEQYVLVADGKYVITSVDLGTLDLEGKLGDNALALVEVDVDTDNDRITNLTSALNDEIGLNDVQWTAKSVKLVDGVFNMSWKSNSKVNKGYMSASEAEAEVGDKVTGVIKTESWPLIVDAQDTDVEEFDNTKWYMDYTTGSYLYTTEEVVVSDDDFTSDSDYSDTEADASDINYYVAVNAEQGYAYLTTEKAKAAHISAYQLSASFEITGIEIVEDADKLAYVEGESFDPAGMKVNVTLSDGSVVCIPEEYFPNFGVRVAPAYYDSLSVKDNDQPYYAWIGNDNDADPDDNTEIGNMWSGYAEDASNVMLTVTARGAFKAELPEGELKDGYYAIVWCDEADEFTKNKNYSGYALDADDTVTVRRFNRPEYLFPTDYSFGKLGANNEVIIRNNAIQTLDKSAIWYVKAAGNNSYTIQLAGTDLYLNRASLTYRDLWAVEEIATLPSNVAKAEAKAYIENNKLVALGEYDETTSLWKIDGTCDASIESAGVKGKGDNEYIYRYEGEAAAEKQFASRTPATFISTVAAKNDREDKYDNFFFFACESIVPTKLEVIHQPALSYNSGDKLDLSDLVVRVSYNNGLNPVEVMFDDLNTLGITTSVENGKVLVGSDNGTTITVSLGNLTASTDKLAVADSTAAVKDTRLGGADRYATAALIAENTITVLADAYTGNVVLASGEDYPDALAGAGLASAANAPIVLTKAAALPAATADFLKNNNVKTVYIIGGIAAVSEDVAKAIEAMGIKVERISGSDRVETSVNVAKKAAELSAKTSDTIIITTGNGYADALSVSSAAAIKNIPVVYASGALSDSVKALLTDDVKTVIVLGGTKAVSADVEAEVKAMGKAVVRLSGSTRYDTGVAINEYFADAFEGKAITIATGAAFADALAGSAYAAAVKAPVVLVDSEYSNTNVRDYVLAADFTDLVVFGGTAAVPAETVDAILGK